MRPQQCYKPNQQRYSDYSENEEKTGNKNTNEDTKIHQQIVKKLSETKETKSDK